MSIKNIIQQENDLQEMSQQSLRNYLNSPTGQYNPYLVAGELQRKEQYAERKMVEAPQQTVVDELVQNTMPMGGMPTPPSMPMPRPQETMVSDTITETGIANLPAPNVGQNYADGGIIGYEEGGEVEEIEDYTAMEMLTEMAQEPDLVAEVGGSALLKAAGVASPYIKGAGLGALFYSPELGSAEDPNFLAKMQGQQNYADGGIIGYAKGGDEGLQSGEYRYEEMTPENKNYETYLEEIRKIPEPSFSGISQMERNRLIEEVKDKYKSPYQKEIDTIEAENQGGFYFDPKTSSGFNPLRGIDFRQYDDQQREDLKYLKDQEDKYYKGDSEIQNKLKEQNFEKALKEEEARGLAALNSAENKVNSRAERDAYLALALGGAKTMAGQSPFALTNIGEGLGAGVGALAQSDANERARMDARRSAYDKYMYDMSSEQRLSGKDYGKLVETIQDSEIFRVKLAQKAAENNIDVDDPQYQTLIQETIQEVLPLYTSPSASNSTTVNGKTFSSV